MDGDPGSIRGSLIEKLSQKASLSQKVFDNTFSVFGRLKEVLHEMSSEIDDALEEEGKDEEVLRTLIHGSGLTLAIRN